MSSRPRTFGDLEPSKFPGERLGMPERGPGSIGRAGRRIAALAVDYAIALGLALLIDRDYQSQANTLWTLAVFALMQVLFIPTIGGSIGHRVLGLRILALDGSWVGFGRPIVRTLLLLVIFPALVWDSDQRGFHDKIAGTVLVRSA